MIFLCSFSLARRSEEEKHPV